MVSQKNIYNIIFFSVLVGLLTMNKVYAEGIVDTGSVG